MKKSRRFETTTAEGQNNFKHLRALVQQAGMKLGAAPDPPACPKSHEDAAVPEPETDEEVFRRATEGVNRASWRHTSFSSPPPPPQEIRVSADEERRLMQAAVDGDPALSVPDHPEYIEGWIGVSGKRFLPALRNGLYSIQEQIDLHGLSREDAHHAVEEFISHASRFRSCCVKIIHGRGINSRNDKAVLKESLQRWLSTRRMSRHVVAYASAPLNDGGVGAIYVLLKQSNG
jgi:DNA-nicking Smr family endonuclease